MRVSDLCVFKFSSKPETPLLVNLINSTGPQRKTRSSIQIDVLPTKASIALSAHFDGNVKEEESGVGAFLGLNS